MMPDRNSPPEFTCLTLSAAFLSVALKVMRQHLLAVVRTVRLTGARFISACSIHHCCFSMLTPTRFLFDACRSILTFSRRRGKRQSCICVARDSAELLEQRQLLAVTGIQAVHRSGQTFLTWNEDTSVAREQYHVYRSSVPITTANLNTAERLTDRWGPLEDDSSVHRLAGDQSPATFVIEDLGQPLSQDQGLFVFTTSASHSTNAWYAVTQITNGVEDTTLVSNVNSLAQPLAETTAQPQPVLVTSINDGKGRVYTQFMDYQQWNPSFQGYAYNYSVALPHDYSADTQWPLKLVPHAYGERYRLEPEAEYEWPVIQVFVDDPGDDAGTTSTWWYGFAADHNYQTDGAVPSSGVISNFTEQRLLRTIDEVMSQFSVDSTRIHAEGNSMGASGALSLGMRYGNVFSGIYASQPMTNYAASPLFQEDFQKLWGTQSSALPIVNAGPHATHLKHHDGVSVYDWMNHQSQIVERRGDDMAFLMFGHGKDDTVIDWQTQGQPFMSAVNAANVAFVAEQRDNWIHNFMGFDFLNPDMLSGNNTDLGTYVLRHDLTFPGLTHATTSGPDSPGPAGDDRYNSTIDWSVPWHSFHEDPVDETARYELTLRSQTDVLTVTVTPRNLQRFAVKAFASYAWQNVNSETGSIVQSGVVRADADGLLSIPAFVIGTGTGNRLQIEPAVSTPQIIAPADSTASQRPEFRWTGVNNAVEYELWISNLSTGQNPAVRITTNSVSHIPDEDLGIGRFRVWVQATTASGDQSAWSAPHDLIIHTPVVLTDLPQTVDTEFPTISWTAIPGAAHYDLWINNQTTGQSQVVRHKTLTSTSFTTIEPLPIGRYTAWVRALDASGVAAKWSVGEPFTAGAAVELTGPLNPTFDQTPAFSWQPRTGAVSYEVYIRNRTTQATVANVTDLSERQWTPAVPLPHGEYRWWSRAVGLDRLRALWSQAADFSVGGIPIPIGPAGPATDRTPKFTWTTVDGAERYELWVSRLDGSGRVIHETSLTMTEFTSAVTLDLGDYRIWLRAVSDTGVVSNWSRSLDFSIVNS
jgi:hypothetical protein